MKFWNDKENDLEFEVEETVYEETEEVVEEEVEEIIPDQQSVLHDDTHVVGDIQCDSNLAVYGYVKGSINCKYNLKLQSKVDAEISAGSIDLAGAEVNGNITCRKELKINNESVITGDINAGDCVIDGTVKGNIVVANSIHIQKNAVVDGDITAKEISLLRGARINGKLTMTQD